MNFYLVFLLLGPEPLAADLDRLGLPDEATCVYQAELYREHALYLRYRRSASGYERGRWDVWMRENARGLDYWEMLGSAWRSRNAGELMSCRMTLGRLRDLIGEGPYYAGYHPQKYPEPAEEEEDTTP